MRCPECDHCLWNTPRADCPECGAAVTRRDFDFSGLTVVARCPSCSADTELQIVMDTSMAVRSLDVQRCGKCGTDFGLNEVLMRAVSARQEARHRHLWCERRKPVLAAWWQALCQILVHPARFGASLPQHGSLKGAISFALCATAFVVLAGLVSGTIVVLGGRSHRDDALSELVGGTIPFFGGMWVSLAVSLVVVELAARFSRRIPVDRRPGSQIVFGLVLSWLLAAFAILGVEVVLSLIDIRAYEDTAFEFIVIGSSGIVIITTLLLMPAVWVLRQQRRAEAMAMHAYRIQGPLIVVFSQLVAVLATVLLTPV